MDASQYKDYVLALLFVKYVSDRFASGRHARIEVPPGGGFADMAKLKGNKEIGDKINDADKLGRGKDMVDRLTNLVAIFASPALDFRANRADGDDILGDAYEYLMRNFATQSGKSKGQFYTPAEVSRIIAKVIGAGSARDTNQTTYDPTCGSGSLLLKAHDEAPVDIGIFGQEMDNATAALARMNMILHNCDTAEIHRDNTLAAPFLRAPGGELKTFDCRQARCVSTVKRSVCCVLRASYTTCARSGTPCTCSLALTTCFHCASRAPTRRTAAGE